MSFLLFCPCFHKVLKVWTFIFWFPFVNCYRFFFGKEEPPLFSWTFSQYFELQGLFWIFQHFLCWAFQFFVWVVGLNFGIWQLRIKALLFAMILFKDFVCPLLLIVSLCFAFCCLQRYQPNTCMSQLSIFL